jgi:hypothetical protein
MINIKILSCPGRILTIVFPETVITKPMNNMIYRLRAVVPVLILLAISACQPGDKKVPVYTVKGVVTENGKPLENATVVLHVSSAIPDVPKPTGKTNAQGEFQLTTYETNDGAPAGDYAVTVEKWTTLRPDEGPANRLNARYAKPASSKLLATVKPEPNQTLPTLELKK